MTLSLRGTIASLKIRVFGNLLSTHTSFANWPVDSTSSILKAIVKPSQQSPDNAHKAGVALKSNGLILPG